MMLDDELNVVSRAPDLLFYLIIEWEKTSFHLAIQFITTYELQPREKRNPLYPSKKVLIE